LKKFTLFLIIIASFFLTAFSSNDIPTEIEKVNLKLKEEQIAMTFLDLASGEATLIQHGSGKTILLNTGGPGTQAELEQLLKLYDIHSINTLILTKNDPEYTSNTEWLTSKFIIGKIITGYHHSQHINEKKYIKWKSGQKTEILPGLTAHVIHENEDVSGSLGLDVLFSLNKHQLLYMTSSNIEVEKALLENMDLSSVNILKVADFASKEGTSEAFVEHIDPQAAIIFKKRGVLASQDVIERLQETWIDIYLTKQFGNITIKFDKDNYEIITISVESSTSV
jgi:competence protein ComEC